MWQYLYQVSLSDPFLMTFGVVFLLTSGLFVKYFLWAPKRLDKINSGKYLRNMNLLGKVCFISSWGVMLGVLGALGGLIGVVIFYYCLEPIKKEVKGDSVEAITNR